MKRHKHFAILSLLIISLTGMLAVILASVTATDSFDTGVWIQHSGVAVGRLSGPSGPMVALAGDGFGKLHAWTSNGAEIAGFPKTLQNHATALAGGGILQEANNYVYSTSALVDINQDGTLEIFVGGMDGYVYGFDHLGNNLPGWPQFTGVSTGDGVYGVFSSPTVADIDGNGDFEVIVGTWSHFVYVWNTDGTIYPGWPFNNADTIWSSPAVADFNRDGNLEIVIGADSSFPPGGLLHVFRYTGEEVSGWPQYIDQVIWSSPAIGDIDNDGLLEIVVGTGHAVGGGKGEYVNAYEFDSSKVAGWPHSLADPATDSRVFSSPALADVDNNGTLETFVGALDGYLYCINSNGTRRWRETPRDADNAKFDVILGSPVVGDIDGDGRLEVVVGGGASLVAFDADTGVKEAGYPVNTSLPQTGIMYVWGKPAIANFDADNLIEILQGTGRKDDPGAAGPGNPPSSGGLRVYHETGSAGTTNLGPTGVSLDIAPWPRFRRTNRAGGSTDEDPANQGGTPSATALSATPFVFSPNTDGLTMRIKFSSPENVRFPGKYQFLLKAVTPTVSWASAFSLKYIARSTRIGRVAWTWVLTLKTFGTPFTGS